MNHSMPHDNLKTCGAGSVDDRKVRRSVTTRTINRRGILRLAKRLALGAAFVSFGLLYTIHPIAVQGSKVIPQAKAGDIPVQASRVQAVSTAVVNFRELAKQQALNPDDSEPLPLAISPPKTIEEVNGEGEPEARMLRPGSTCPPL